MLKPMLARGELHAIGATTLDEYRKHIEKDPALERRFQPILVGEPTVEETISILRGLRERYEVHHGVRITDGALVAAPSSPTATSPTASCRTRRLTLLMRRRPACVWRLKVAPSRWTRWNAASCSSRSSARRFARSATRPARRGWAKSTRSLRTLEEKRSELRSRWQSERDALNAVRSVKEKLEEANAELERAQRSADFARASQLQYGTIRDLEAKLKELEANTAPAGGAARLLKEEVDSDDIAAVVSKWTGIPDRATSGRRACQAAANGGAPAPTRNRPGRGDYRCVECRAPSASGTPGPEPSARFLPLPGTDRRRARPSLRGRSPNTSSTTRTR